VEFLTQKAGVDKLLSFRLSNEDVEHPKPHPEIYRKAIERLGVTPQECVAVEDGAYGIEAARRAGCRVFEVQHIDDVNYAALRRFIDEIEAGDTVGGAVAA
jgi:beta-phosphoglucomutase-like phosphatase (HAD superfamily)